MLLLLCCAVLCWHLQEDAYDAVKTNMFDLLAEVAAVCQASQLDMLFAKLERSQPRNVQDAERLLKLLTKLAIGDAEVRTVPKHLQCTRPASTLVPVATCRQPSEPSRTLTAGCTCAVEGVNGCRLVQALFVW